MSLEGHNLPNRDEILKSERLAQKILSYEFSSKRSNTHLASAKEKDTQIQNQAPKHSLMNETPNTLAMFRKYLHEKAHQAMEKTYVKECRAMRHPPIIRKNTMPLKDPTAPRVPSFLERKLFPVTSSRLPCNRSCSNAQSSILPSDRNSSNAQLTIFYSGYVGVYENVPADKAQTIMLLAGESSSLDSERPASQTSDTLHMFTHLPSDSNKQVDLQGARNLSLKRFLDRRRDRISMSCPYEFSTTRMGMDKERTG